ncbi:MAG: MBL fold metallo-hydrolase [Actinobacteria bacterium]|nr:MBL fold metallo-hydrolase [Actinomycetota bacterium]
MHSRRELLIPGGEELVSKCRPWIDSYVSADQSEILLSIHSFIIETPDDCIVVDTCIGAGHPWATGALTFEERLLAALPAGYDSVDRVVCTHLHSDHVGWNTVERSGMQVPRFPNAVAYRIASQFGILPQWPQNRSPFGFPNPSSATSTTSSRPEHTKVEPLRSEQVSKPS